MVGKKKLIEVFSSNTLRVIYGIGMMAFITKHYSMDEAGSYFLVLAIITLLNDLKEGFFLSGFIKYLVEEKANMKVATTGLIVSFCWDVGSFLVFMIITIWFPAIESFKAAYLIHLILSSFFKWITYLHRAQLETSIQFKSNIIALLAVIIGVVWMYLFDLSVEYCLIILGISNFLPCVLLKKNLMLIKSAFVSLSFERSIYKKLGYFGKYGVLLSIVGGLSHQSGIFLSAEFLDLAQTALLGLGARYAILITLPANSMSSLIYPEMLKCKGDKTKMRSVGVFGTGKMYAILIPIGLVITLCSPIAILLFHGHEYLFVSVIIAFRTIAMLINLPLSSAYTSAMNSLNKPFHVSELVIINSVVNIILIIPMMYFWGIWGAIIAPFSIEILGYMIMTKRLKKEVDFQFQEIPVQIKGFWMYWFEKYNPFKTTYKNQVI